MGPQMGEIKLLHHRKKTGICRGAQNFPDRKRAVASCSRIRKVKRSQPVFSEKRGIQTGQVCCSGPNPLNMVQRNTLTSLQ